MVGSRLSRIALILLGAATLSSCTTLPDTSAYTAATLQVKNSAVAAGGALQSEFVRMSERLPPNFQAEAASKGARFDGAWQKTVGSLDALGRYAESIEEITKAGNSGGASARAVAQSVQSLAEAVSIVPGAQLAGVATDTAALIYSQIANIRAARSLARSLDNADPLIRDMAQTISGQVTEASTAFDNVITLERRALDFSVQDIEPLDTQLEAAEKEAAMTLAARVADHSPESERLAAEANLKRIREGRDALAPQMNAYHTELAALEQRAEAGRELFAATNRAVVNWREGHTRLATAIRERRPFSVQSLLASAEEIRGLVERWHKL